MDARIVLRRNTKYNVAMRGLRIVVVSLALGASCVAQSGAEQVTRVPAIAPNELRRAWQDIYATAPTLPLTPTGPLAYAGNVWLRTTADGLHIWGKYEGGGQEFRWAQQKSGILASDHIEVWLATSTEVPMPTIGWGNQFGMTELKNVQDCAEVKDTSTGGSGAKKCETWYAEQLLYRQQLRRLFVRQWLVTGSEYAGPTHSFEEFGSSAYNTLSANLFPEDLPKRLKPRSDDPLKVEIAPDVTQREIPDAAGKTHPMNLPVGYRFHIFIPYTEFPPARELNLSDLYVMVDVFSAAAEGQKQGAYATTAPRRQWGRPETFNHIRLDAPRSYEVTPCEYKLQQTDLYDDIFTAWFFPPSKESALASTFALINPEQGYLYEPGGTSPQVWEAKYFWKPLPEGAVVCGPELAWRQGKDIRTTKFTIDQEHFAIKSLADGWSLIRSGPTTSTVSTFGSGSCGSCPVLNFAIYAVSPQGEITKALDLDQGLTGMPDQPSGGDMTIAPDLSRVVLYLNGAGEEEYGASAWKSVTYCRNGHVYKECGEAKNVQPPNPPHYKELRGPEGE